MEKYKTSDLAIASYLVSNNINILETETHDHQRFQFVFDISRQDGITIEDKWWAGSLVVNPRAYFQGIEQMKNMIFQVKKRL